MRLSACDGYSLRCSCLARAGAFPAGSAPDALSPEYSGISSPRSRWNVASCREPGRKTARCRGISLSGQLCSMDIIGYFSGMISQKSRYALRALLYLAARSDPAPVQISEIAEAENIPRKFLEQILLELKKTGIVRSLRGRTGGYAL